MRSTHRRALCCRRLAAALCLFSWMQGAGFVPTLLAFSAALEGSHEVSIAWGRQELAVVLHHHVQPESRFHAHGVASRILCSLGDSTRTSRPDHVLAFAGPSACEEQSREAAHLATEDSAVARHLPAVIPPPALPPFEPADVNLLGAVDSSPLHGQRTTILLI